MSNLLNGNVEAYEPVENQQFNLDHALIVSVHLFKTYFKEAYAFVLKNIKNNSTGLTFLKEKYEILLRISSSPKTDELLDTSTLVQFVKVINHSSQAYKRQLIESFEDIEKQEELKQLVQNACNWSNLCLNKTNSLDST